MNNSKYIVRFLCSFFYIFGGYIKKVSICDNKVVGEILFDDDEFETQAFIWHFSDLFYIRESILFLDYSLDNNLINGDKFIFSKADLIKRIEKLSLWDKKEVPNIINYICNLNIKMVDEEGEETDSFFIHF
ncbi:MAG: hypothetical protein FWF54_10325 [Candidatus Azobacteroides sp.]|nr:hypothetical protein [Candidatus Azobacteroides sp.]